MAIFSGDIFAEQYVISSSVTEVTIGSVSGSTAFGDTQDDTHQFTGSLSVSGSLTSEGITSKGTAPFIDFEETDQSGINHKLSMQVNSRVLSWNSVGDGGFVSTDFQMHRTNSGAYYHKWFIAGSSKMILSNNGYLGIGTTTPEAALEVIGDISGSASSTGSFGKVTIGGPVFNDVSASRHSALTVHSPSGAYATGSAITIVGDSFQGRQRINWDMEGLDGKVYSYIEARGQGGGRNRGGCH